MIDALHSPEFLLIALQIRIQIAGYDAVGAAVRGPSTRQQGRRRLRGDGSGSSGHAALQDGRRMMRTLATVDAAAAAAAAGGQIVGGLGGAICAGLWLVRQLEKVQQISVGCVELEGRERTLTCCLRLVGFLGTCGGTLAPGSVGVARLLLLRVEAPAKLLRLLGDGGGRGCSTSGGGGGGSGSSKV